ncbi:hypothetical protein A9Q84_06040 [Halobacteriovorax marinus]|uniref:Uncharacterized protein n=1 Tax=Halobacteriovorax marinus TaxID=97084 RepID=A0A1Y5F9P9_9BACT|nr:hypothetical protein A9Q84_06040 [Halobacteriovorax marinus]
MNKILIFLFLLSLSGKSLSSEIDNFAHFNHQTPDVTQDLNELTNNLMLKAISKANSKHIVGEFCSKSILYKSLKGSFAKPLRGQIEEYILKKPETIPQLRIPLEHSIYNGFRGIDFITRLPYGKLGSIVNINGVYVGSDKFGHFHTEGLEYFFKAYKDKSIPEVLGAMKWGIKTEESYFGRWTTGVISYADLAANFNGMRFWNNVLALKPDILEQSNGPYVECSDEKWIQIKRFDWGRYIDETFDETINCNKFSSNKLRTLHDANVKRIYGEDVFCGASEELIYRLKEKYSEYFSLLSNMTLIP